MLQPETGVNTGRAQRTGDFFKFKSYKQLICIMIVEADVEGFA